MTFLIDTIRRFQDAVDQVLEQTKITGEEVHMRNALGWYDGAADLERRHIKAPSLAESVTAEDLVQGAQVWGHELGHIEAPIDHPMGKIYRETVCDLWADKVLWTDHELPYQAQARFYAGRALGECARSEIAKGMATVAEIRGYVPDEFLRYMGALWEPEYLHEMNADQLRRAMRNDPDVSRRISRMREWVM
jgi:hypothetical protein